MTDVPERQDPPPPSCGTCGCPLARHGWKSRVDPSYCHGCNRAHEFVWANPDDKLHSRCAHPGWEYATTDGPRKAWYDADTPPEGDGWVSNSAVGDNGWERFDYHEESYWRRPKPPVAVLAVEPGANAEDCPHCGTDLPYPWICPGHTAEEVANTPPPSPYWDGIERRLDQMTDIRLDAVWKTLAEVRRIAEGAVVVTLPNERATYEVRAVAGNLIRLLDGTTPTEPQP